MRIRSLVGFVLIFVFSLIFYSSVDVMKVSCRGKIVMLTVNKYQREVLLFVDELKCI